VDLNGSEYDIPIKEEESPTSPEISDFAKVMFDKSLNN